MSQPGIATVRLLTDATADQLSDTQLSDLLALHDGAVKLAAADALELLAARIERVSSDDITLDGSSAQLLMARADKLRAQHLTDVDADGFTFDVIDTACRRPELTPPEAGWC